MCVNKLARLMQAFLATWEKACKGKESKILVPSKSTFLVGPISFNGRSCQPNIVLQVSHG